MAISTSEAKKDGIRKQAEADFISFVKLVAPYNVMAHCHKDLCNFLSNPDSKPYRLVLYPRGHRKSFYLAMYACWRIVQNPAITIMYLSATAPLAESQLRLIKTTLDSPIVRKFWKDLINPEEGKRAMWQTSEIIVDHPKRIIEGVRDSTIKAGGLTMNITGSHVDLILLDDLVVPQNNNEAGRREVAAQYSQLQSILNPSGEIRAVGTRYSPKDLYNDIMNTYEDVFDDDGELIGRDSQWSVLERVVETDGDFLWARTVRGDGKAFGFDFKELARIKAGYLDKSQFYAQYYNNPNDASLANITEDMFQYYNKNDLRVFGGKYYIHSKILNVFSAMDFAYSLKPTADFTTIAVVGIDSQHNRYILDLDRFKTNKIQEYYDHLIALHSKYGFRKVRLECTAAQEVIVQSLKEKLGENSISLNIDMYRPTRNKEERMDATLRPLYEDGKVFHYKGGLCEILEEELKSNKPLHDDMKNALADALDIAIPPKKMQYVRQTEPVKPLSRFGGY